jgi:hypothetical protein
VTLKDRRDATRVVRTHREIRLKIAAEIAAMCGESLEEYLAAKKASEVGARPRASDSARHGPTSPIALAKSIIWTRFFACA